jgi:hypothetical protein
VFAHCPAVGVNVYDPVAELLTNAFQDPVMEGVFVELVGKTGAVVPEQIAATGANVGVIVGFTVTESVVVFAHCPADGVNVYDPVAELLTNAFQEPVMEGVFVELVGKTGAVVPEQIAATGANVGVTVGFTVTESVVVFAHCPADGVNVYDPVAELLTNAFQEPVMEGVFVELVGKTGAVVPEQIAATGANVGVTVGFTVTESVVVFAHCPADGVNVYDPVAELLTNAFQDPVMEGVFVELVGKTGAVVPEQIAATGANVGVTVGFTVTESVVVFAHCPADGVNVYDPVAELLTNAFQDPVMEGVFVELIGKTGAVVPEQIAATGANVGVIVGFTVTESVVVFAHCPADGVNVYDPVAELLTNAFQEPVMEGVFVELVGKTGAVVPEQIAATGANVGVTVGFTVTESVVVFAHCPADGVNVYDPVAELLTNAFQEPAIEGVFVELIGKTGAVVPEQIAATGANVGVTVGFTVTESVVVFAHCPADGVNVYDPVAELLTNAFQEPAIEGVFVELVGKTGAVVPEQIAATGANVGVTVGFTVTESIVVFAHCPADGVKVYDPVAELLTNAFQDPVMEGVFVELVGKTGAVVPEQIAATGANVGVTVGFTVTESIVVFAHCPADGVKVYDPVAELLTNAFQDPVMEGVFVELVGKTGAVVPEQIAATGANVGVIVGFTVTESVVVFAHCPADGVNVYDPVAELLTNAFQDPVMEGVFVELVGKTGAVVPEQIAATGANVGVTVGFTVTESVAVFAHCPADGVNVYDPVAELLTNAFQEPAIEGVFVELVGKTGAVVPEQIAATGANVGVIVGFTVTESVVVFAHCPADGVNV